MKFKKHGHQNRDETIKHVSDKNHECCDHLLLVSVLCSRVIHIKEPLNGVEPAWEHGHNDIICQNKYIHEEQEEEFAIPEADTVINPRTMMVHIENTSIAGGTVMAAFWLKDIAHQAVSTSLVFRISPLHTPVRLHLSRICCHRHYEGPNHHEKA